MITSTNSNIALTNMDNTRSNRRHHRSSQMEPEFSNASIMNAMEKFVNAVQEMDETILVPCRLMDLKVGDSADKEDEKTMVHQLMNHADLYSLYTMVNAVKNELLWGQNLQPSEDTPLFNPGVVHGTNYIPSGVSSLPPSQSTPNCIAYNSLPAQPPQQQHNKTHSRNNSASMTKHQRRPSTGSLVSTHSLASMSMSDTDSETGVEVDSGIEDGSLVDPTLNIAVNFRRHLHGLYKSLEQLSNAAVYLTERYQHDVGGVV